MLNNYIKDEITGFLTPTPLCPSPSFSAEQKKTFIAKYSQFFNLTKAAKHVNVPRRLVTLHLKEDKVFKEAVEEAANEVLDEIEENLYRQSFKSPIAAMQFLKAKRPLEWGSKKTVEPVDKASDKLKKLLDDAE